MLPSEDLEDYSIIKKNLDNIENYNFEKLLSKYNNDFIVSIFFQNNNNLNVLSKINFNSKINQFSLFLMKFYTKNLNFGIKNENQSKTMKNNAKFRL